MYKIVDISYLPNEYFLKSNKTYLFFTFKGAITNLFEFVLGLELCFIYFVTMTDVVY